MYILQAHIYIASHDMSELQTLTPNFIHPLKGGKGEGGEQKEEKTVV